MILKGGYSLIDCSGWDFADTSEKKPELFKKLEVAYKANKFVLCSNMVNGAAKFSPIPAFVSLVGSGDSRYIVLTVMNIAYNIAVDGTITS